MGLLMIAAAIATLAGCAGAGAATSAPPRSAGDDFTAQQRAAVTGSALNQAVRQGVAGRFRVQVSDDQDAPTALLRFGSVGQFGVGSFSLAAETIEEIGILAPDYVAFGESEGEVLAQAVLEGDLITDATVKIGALGGDAYRLEWTISTRDSGVIQGFWDGPIPEGTIDD
jgi:hypothetical protein